MTSPYLVPCLFTLRAEFSDIAPSRDKGADGWIGDAAHQSRTSDHNPDSQGRVLAVDIDSTGPWPVPFDDLVEDCRGDARLEYVIWNKRIASRSHGWVWKPYYPRDSNGVEHTDPHTGHAHFSARHDHTLNNSTARWGLEDLIMPTAQEIATAVVAELHGTYGKTLTKDAKGVFDSGDGRAVWWHGVNGAPAWQLLDGTHRLAEAIAAKLDVPTSQVLAAVGQVDDQVLASLADAGRSDEDVAASLRAALGERATTVGRILAGS